MNRASSRGEMLVRLTWLPVAVYFVVKYLLFANDMTRRQNLILLGVCLLGELGLWLYVRNRHRADTSE